MGPADGAPTQPVARPAVGSRWWGPAALLFCYYGLASLIFTYPLFLSLGSGVNDPVDPILNSWILAWNHHALLSQPLALLDANIFYPYTQTLLYSETLLLPSLLLLPVRLATGNPLLTYNLFVLLGFISTGIGGHLLGRRLLGSHWAGLLLGTVLAFNSYTLGQLPKAQLLQFAWLPLALLCTARLLRRPSLRRAALLGGLLAAQFYTVVYYGLFAFLVVGLVGGGGWLLLFSTPGQRRWRSCLFLLAGGLLGLLLCLPLALRYFALSAQLGFARTLADAWPFAASLQAWRTPPFHSLLYGWLVQAPLPRVGFYSVTPLFPGLGLLALAGLGLASRIGAAAGRPGRAPRPWTLLYSLALLLGIGLFFLLSLGPYLQMTSLQPDFGRELPYVWLHRWVPGFTALRAPDRFAELVFLGLGGAAADLVVHLRRPLLRAALIAFVFLESLSLPAAGLFTPKIGREEGGLYAWLAAQPPTVYLELPVYAPTLDGEAPRWLESQLRSTLHWQRTPAGYSGFLPPHHDDFLLFVSRFPAPAAVHLLGALGVEWLLLHADRLPAGQRQAVVAAAQREGWALQEWGSVWTIHLPPMSAGRPTRAAHIPTVAQLGGELTLDLLYTAQTPTPLLPNSDLGALRVEWWQGERQVLAAGRRVQPPFYVDPLAISPVSVPVPVAAGLYTLRLLDPGDGQLLAAGAVAVAADVAPPEIRLAPLAGAEAEIVCVAGQTQVRFVLRTIGWYTEPLTLSVRLWDGQGVAAARSAVDVEFPAHRPRRDLLTTHLYALPLTDLAFPVAQPLTAEIFAYHWQQAAERTVARHFATADRGVVSTLQLPVTEMAPCVE